MILPTPDGKLWTQDLARQFAGVNQPDYDVDSLEKSITKSSASDEQSTKKAKGAIDKKGKHYIIICPHYEGYDARILPLANHCICLGPYVLTGGELPALIIIDSVVRLIPGVLGGETSASMESFSDGDNIEYPQYTKPAEFRGMKVPDILLSGDHRKVAKWRADASKKL